MTPLRIFIGFDYRQPIAYNVLAYSILHNASVPVAITPLKLSTLPIAKTGLTEFTFTRFLVPWLCDYEGPALFLDADMVVDADIKRLFDGIGWREESVLVAPTKEKFERASAMLFNCGACVHLTPDFVETGNPFDLESWGTVGLFPAEWNYCVGYDHEDITPKLIHYTAGLPIWPETENCRFADVWHKYHRLANGTVSYNELMARSVHHKRVVSGEINR